MKKQLNTYSMQKVKCWQRGKSYGQQFCFPQDQCQDATVLIQGVRSGRRETPPSPAMSNLGVALSLGHAFYYMRPPNYSEGL